MKKINDWVIKTFGLRGSWSWAKKQMLNGAIIKRKATTGTYKIAIDNDKNRLLVATWGHLDQNPVWERCPHSLRLGLGTDPASSLLVQLVGRNAERQAYIIG